MQFMTPALRRRLERAVADEPWSDENKEILLDSLRRCPDGTPIMEDLSLVVGDGVSPQEMVSVAVDYFGLD